MLITKIAAVMLVHTGLSQQSAQFQARSAFTGVGFATSEAESVVNHPVRRKIIMSLMLIGNAGIITAMASLMLTFVGSGQNDMNWPVKLMILILSLLLLWFVASSKVINRILSTYISKALKKYTSLIVRDYSSLLHLTGGFSITELKVNSEDWLNGKNLREARLNDEGINILGIQREAGEFIGVPTAVTVIKAGDTLLIYGQEDILAKLDARKNDFFGDLEHAQTAQHLKENNPEDADNL